MTNATSKSSKRDPESTFLINNPVVSPANMSNCILTRTSALTGCLIDHLINHDGSPLPVKLVYGMLDQIDANLQMLKRITNVWHKQDVRLNKQIEGSTSLHCETEGLID